MRKCALLRIAPLSFLTVSLVAAELPAAVIYSNLQGNYAAQQTASYTVDKGSYSASGYSSNYDFGFTGVGDDYSVDPSAPTAIVNGVPSVQISGFSFYGNAAPTAGNPTGSLGTSVTAYFFNSFGTFYPQSINANSEFQGATGLKSFSFTPTYVPAQGYIIFSPQLYSTNNGTGSTPRSYGETTLTGYFGGAPTIGSSSGTAFATTDTNRTLSTPAAPAGSQGYLQFSLIGVPEPTMAAILGLGLYGSLARRRHTI